MVSSRDYSLGAPELARWVSKASHHVSESERCTRNVSEAHQRGVISYAQSENFRNFLLFWGSKYVVQTKMFIFMNRCLRFKASNHGYCSGT